MPVAQMFEERLEVVEHPAVFANGRADASASASRDTSDSAGTGAGSGADRVVNGSADDDVCDDTVPVPEPLAGLLPGGLHRGEVAALATRHREQHPDYLALALLAEALNAGLWCAVVGVPDLGVPALAGMLGFAPGAGPEGGSSSVADRVARRQAALDRLLLIPDPGERWDEALATLADGVDLLLVRPPAPVSTEIATRIDAHLRPRRSADSPGTPDAVTHRAALLVLGSWPSAQLSLRITRADWTGLDGIGPTAGAARLTGCRATVVAQGWATAGRPRAARLWLPDANGSVRALSDDPRAAASRPLSTTN